MLNLSDWEREVFAKSSYISDLTVLFPSREIYFSPELLRVMRFEASTCPKTLDQWYELCHPEDHYKISKFEKIIYGHEQKNSFSSSFSFSRKLYCGDGVYRNFRLDAFIHRDRDGNPSKLTGNETLALSAWLANASEGDRIECENPNGGTKILEAVRIQGIMTLVDISMIEDLQQENFRLRREIQRRVFSSEPPENLLSDSELNGSELILKNILEDNINSAINILNGGCCLKALKRSLNERDLTVGVTGLSGSGKSLFINAFLGDKLIPSKFRTNIPIICREGRTANAEIFYQDGRIESIKAPKLSSEKLEKIVFESSNPKNRTGIARIEITLSGALIPEGICFVDTPGFDSSGSSVLKNILPELDVVFYVMPLRARLKGSDYEYLKLIMRFNENIIFILSQTDLERDDSEAGRVLYSADEKISDDITSLKYEIKKFCGKDVSVIPVSAKNAIENFYDRKSKTWLSSNFESVLNYIKSLRKNAFKNALIFRAERALKFLEEMSVNQENTGSSRWKVQEIMENLRKVQNTRAQLPEVPENRNFHANIHKEIITYKTGGQNLFSSLMTSVKERKFRNEFFSLDAFDGGRRAVFLGAEKAQSLKLFSRLAHNLMLEKFSLPDGGVSSSEWLCSGYEAPFGCIKIPPLGTYENILIAPSDMDINKKILDWKKFFKKYVPVVSVDLARLDSGLSDLAYAPYITGLAFSKWVLAFGNAGLFDTRQIDLVSKIPISINEFIEANGLEKPDMFIFENYNIF